MRLQNLYCDAACLRHSCACIETSYMPTMQQNRKALLSPVQPPTTPVKTVRAPEGCAPNLCRRVGHSGVRSSAAWRSLLAQGVWEVGGGLTGMGLSGGAHWIPS